MSLRIFQLVNLKKGFSLPLWVAASARSALKKLLGFSFENHELIKIPNETKLRKIKVYSAGLIRDKSYSLAITFVDSGLDLDLTDNLEVWALVSLKEIKDKQTKLKNIINIVPGYGVGVNKQTSKICISDFALKVIEDNLIDIIPPRHSLSLEIIFPNGRFLAERTSNKSFGIVDGLSIIGTTAEVYASASPDQINIAKANIDKAISEKFSGVITFVIGENGLDLAKRNNILYPVIKVGNWIGPLLVYAATKNVKQILLLGYHGKLIKLAGGIFHTHNHLADARIEILVYMALKEKVSLNIIKKISDSTTIEEALNILQEYNLAIANKLWVEISNKIEKRSFEYIQRHLISDVVIGVALFDKQRNIRWKGQNGQSMF